MHKEDFIYGEEKNCYVGINRSSIVTVKAGSGWTDMGQ